jgi:hypothetical protein
MKSFQDRFLTFGTNAERLTYTPDQLYAKFYETDTDDYYVWNGGAWILINGSGTGGMVQHANEWHTPDMELENTNIQTHVTGTGSPHTAAGVGAETSGAVATHAAITSSVHGFDSSGNAPAQSHGNTRHTDNYALDSDLTTHVGLTTTAHGGLLPATSFSGLAKITVSATAPVAPGVGDLWVDTT